MTNHEQKAREIADAIKRSGCFDDDAEPRTSHEIVLWCEAVEALFDAIKKHDLFRLAYEQGLEEAADVCKGLGDAERMADDSLKGWMLAQGAYKCERAVRALKSTPAPSPAPQEQIERAAIIFFEKLRELYGPEDASWTEEGPDADEGREAMRAGIRALAAAGLLSRAPAPEWQPIETAPKDGTKIDLWQRRRVTDAYWSSVEDRWCVDGYYGPEEPTPLSTKPVTHWMPPPPRPAKQK